MSDDSPLEDLLVDEEELNEELLAETVSRYTKLGSESGSLIPESTFQDLSAKEKILVALLAQKVKFELELVDNEKIGPSMISELTGVKSGTVYPSVRELDELGLARNEDGKYWIPTVSIGKAKSYLDGEDQNEGF